MPGSLTVSLLHLKLRLTEQATPKTAESTFAQEIYQAYVYQFHYGAISSSLPRPSSTTLPGRHLGKEAYPSFY